MRLLLFFLSFTFTIIAQREILVVGNHTSLCLKNTPGYFICDTLPSDLNKFYVIMLFSGATSKLSPDDIERIVEFTNKGGGLYSGAENWPLQAESNQMTHRLYKKESFGEYEQVNAQYGNPGGNLRLNREDTIPAGKTTVAFPMDYRLKVEAWVEDQPLLLSGTFGEGRIVIDGGYSRFYCDRQNEKSDLLWGKILTYLLQ